MKFSWYCCYYMHGGCNGQAPSEKQQGRSVPCQCHCHNKESK